MLRTTDKAVRTKLRSLLETSSGSTTRVVPRWLLDFTVHDWASIVRSITDNGKTDGWLITRTKMNPRRVAVGQWEHRWTYALWYFRSYEQGTGSSNSEDSLNAMLESVTQAFENSEQLGFTGDEIDGHYGLNVENIDTIDNQVHAVMANIVVVLTSQP